MSDFLWFLIVYCSPTPCAPLSFLFQYMTNMTANNWTSIPCDPFVNFCPAGLVRASRPP